MQHKGHTYSFKQVRLVKKSLRASFAKYRHNQYDSEKGHTLYRSTKNVHLAFPFPDIPEVEGYSNKLLPTVIPS